MARALATYPALGSVRMPASAVIVAVHPQADLANAPSLLVEYDDADERAPVERSFLVLRCAKGTPVPPGASYVSSWRRHPADGGLAALYEKHDADVPDHLPAEMHGHYRLLINDGFTPAARKVGPGFHAWKAPADVPAGNLSREQMVAVAELQEHGFGPVVA